MTDPTVSTYAGLPGYLILWVLALVAFALFGRRVARYVRLFLQARPEYRGSRWGQRLGLFAVHVLGQRRFFDEPLSGAPLFLIFWSFVFYPASFFWTLVRGAIPALPIPYADEVPWMTVPLEALGALALIGIGVAAVRRTFFAPPRLERSRGAAVILTLIAVPLLSFLVGEGFRALAGQATAWMPVGVLLSGALFALGLTAAAAPPFFLGSWWVHMVTVLGFLAYLPYSKHLPLLAAPFGVFFGSTAHGTIPPTSEGAARREE